MPFFREFSISEGQKVVNRSRTGPLKAPDTGVIISIDSIVIGDSQSDPYDAIAPSTPIKVTLPGPRERVIDDNGILTPRWRRFFEELYRRTGAYEDNVNDLGRDTGNLSPDPLVISGSTPNISVA